MSPGPAALAAIVLLSAGACAKTPSQGGPSELALDAPVSGVVVENVQACTVDAVCFLRLAFADTTVDAIYGTGERPAPVCTTPVDAADAAFATTPGDSVEVVVSSCVGEGLVLMMLRR